MTDAIRLTASMLDARDNMRIFWGERYELQTQVYRELIRNSAQPGEAVLAAALRVCKRVEKWADENGSPMAVILCIAAAVDECEAGSSLSGKQRT